MDAHEDTPRIQVLSVSDTGRRCTEDEKTRIVEESRRDGVTLAEVARRHEISRSMLYDWRYRHKLGLLGVGEPSRVTICTPSPRRFTSIADNSFARLGISNYRPAYDL